MDFNVGMKFVIDEVITIYTIFGSRDEVSGFFVLSHLWMRGYFRLGWVK